LGVQAHTYFLCLSLTKPLFTPLSWVFFVFFLWY